MRNPHRMCRRCRIRWPQMAGGLCRRCARALGDTRTNFERQKARVDRVKAVPPPAPPTPPAPRRPRTVTINGTEYVVTYDGT